MKRILLSLALVTVMVAGVALSLAPRAKAQEPTNPANPMTISVIGSGASYAAPDVAYVSVGVEISNADVSAAVDEANARVEAILAALETQGIARVDIRTENFNIYRENFYGPEGPTGEGTFRVNNSLRVTVRDITKVATILKATLEAGANSIGGVMYDIANREAVESEARAAAIEDARAVAEELASLMGVTVGEVVAISEDNTGFVPYYDNYGMGGGAAASVSQPPVQAGSLAVNVNVHVVFELVR